MISRAGLANGCDGLIVEQGDSLIDYLDAVVSLRSKIARGGFYRVDGVKIFRSTLVNECDLSEKDGIVVTKIRRLFVIRMVEIEK